MLFDGANLWQQDFIRGVVAGRNKINKTFATNLMSAEATPQVASKVDTKSHFLQCVEEKNIQNLTLKQFLGQ